MPILSLNQILLRLRASYVWIVKTADFSAALGGRYQVDCTSTAITCTLPASANIGDEIVIEDASASFASHNLTVDRNGLKLNGGTSNYVSSTASKRLSLVYISAAYGWSVK